MAKMCQNESFRHFPSPKNTKMKQNESHHDNSWKLLYMVANFYMSGIFSSLNILVQTQLGHYLYHPTSTHLDDMSIIAKGVTTTLVSYTSRGTYGSIM